MSASFSSQFGTPPVTCADGAALKYALWMYDHPNWTPRLSAAIYSTPRGELTLRLWRNGELFREWRGDEATLQAEAEETRQSLERDGWTPR